MKHVTILIVIVLITLFSVSCNQNNIEDKEKKLLQKENELLKKENELLKKELDSYKNNKNEITKRQKPQTQSDDISFLKNFDGKYSHEVKFLENSVIKERLKRLIGDRFTFLEKTWAVETPMEIKNNFFIASACEAHNCNMTNFIVVVDINKNVMYAGVREEGRIKTYSEDGSKIPAQINEWSQR